jgi:hypothetical protein
MVLGGVIAACGRRRKTPLLVSEDTV